MATFTIVSIGDAYWLDPKLRPAAATAPGAAVYQQVEVSCPHGAHGRRWTHFTDPATDLFIVWVPSPVTAAGVIAAVKDQVLSSLTARDGLEGTTVEVV